jgi:hypothetical protein
MKMKSHKWDQQRLLAGLAAASLMSWGLAHADNLKGQVLGGGAPVVSSTVTLWAASAGAPKQLAQVRTDVQGRFALAVPAAGPGTSLYLVAQGGQSAANKAAATTRLSG